MDKGFTLLEIIIAIVVITAGIAGTYAVVSRVLFLNYENTNRFIAAYLAQEGLEVVRNIRDTNWLEITPFDDGLSNGEWRVQYNGNGLLSFIDEPLKIDANGFYNYDSGDDSRFARKVSIAHPLADKINVKVQITWPANRSLGSRESFEIQENLYDWR